MVDPTRDELDAGDVQRVLAGDVNAFEGIVHRWQGPIVDLAFRFCRERGLAEEIAQDAFLKAFRSLSRWRGESRFSTWLFAIAVNVSRSRLRTYRPDWRSLEAIARIADPRNPDTILESADEAEQIKRAVLELPKKYREAIVLYYFHDMDVNEAAMTLRIPVGTVKAHLHRGRERLRKILENERSDGS